MLILINKITNDVYRSAIKSNKPRKTRKEAKGGSLSQDTIVFDDIDSIGESMTHTISKISFFYSDVGIHGFQTFFNMGNALIDGYKNISYDTVKKNKFETKSIEISQDNPLRSVRIYYNDIIEYIVFENSGKNDTFEVGNKAAKENCKEYEFQFGMTYDPLLFFGAIDKRKNGINIKLAKTGITDSLLCMFGVETKLKIYSDKPVNSLSKNRNFDDNESKDRKIEKKDKNKSKKKDTKEGKTENGNGNFDDLEKNKNEKGSAKEKGQKEEIKDEKFLKLN